jgi:hypothetical protein
MGKGTKREGRVHVHGAHTANKEPVRIQYKCSGSHLCLPRNETVISKNRIIGNVLSPSSYTRLSVRDFYISRISLPFLLQGNTVCGLT